MPAYVHLSVAQLVSSDPAAIAGQLATRYQQDGYSSQLTQQTRAWDLVLPLLQDQLRQLQQDHPAASDWTVLIEYPLYRLRKRIDIIILTTRVGIILETKVGASDFQAADERQVEEYALDLRDFHAASHHLPLVPVLWCTEATPCHAEYHHEEAQVAGVHRVGKGELADFLSRVLPRETAEPIDGEAWDQAAYQPVPGIIEAATSIFARHEVESIVRHEAWNLKHAAARIIRLIVQAREQDRRALIFLTGVPGSGKTLAGLLVVHDAITTGAEHEGDIVYLSGNTPLVTVLREALALDEYHRTRKTKGTVLDAIRREVRTRIQHINDYLHQHLKDGHRQPPPEHALVFDEAQRAWDAQQGKKKFNREDSEPTLLLELMNRHPDWCACVCLIGGGQEINAGEQGVAGWGDALRSMDPALASRWSVHLAEDAVCGGVSAGRLALGEIPSPISVQKHPDLQLRVPMRSFRSSGVSEWVELMLGGDEARATAVARELTVYPICLTRSLERARRWLRSQSRGQRRPGLVASSGARRLRAEGLGTSLHAADGMEIAHWYLKPPEDIRSSHALEVTANEYTCQGLELDFVGVCWDGDLVRSPHNERWVYRRLSGSRWDTVSNPWGIRYLENSYRVLLTRAREGMVLFVPRGDEADLTRSPAGLRATADYLCRCGAKMLDS